MCWTHENRKENFKQLPLTAWQKLKLFPNIYQVQELSAIQEILKKRFISTKQRALVWTQLTFTCSKY